MPRLIKLIKQFHFWHCIGVDNTGTALFDKTTSISQDYTQRKVVDHNSLFLLFTTDDVESNDGDGFEMYILESADYCK
jgi:hypothetical protein